ncbi:YHS domain-containing protein [Bacteroidota bacterium]
MKLNRFFSFVFLFTFGLTVSVIAQHDHLKNMEKYSVDSTIIRNGEIDLSVIDGNKDMKVFECPMDWNVLSDSSGRCPVCEMKLKEYSLHDAASNLKEHGFKLIGEDHKMHKVIELESEINVVSDSTSSVIWNKFCPVGGKEVDPNSPTVNYKGKVIGFCCPGCDGKFKEDPKKYMNNLSTDGQNYIGGK